jgi:hypothetical protein
MLLRAAERARRRPAKTLMESEQSIDPQETRTVNEETHCAQRPINEMLKANS